MNSLDLIENDYKNLSNELKKRNPAIKDVRLHLYADETIASGQISTQVDNMLQPLAQIFEAKITKLFIPAMNCLQKLASSFVISDTGILTVLHMLKEGSAENLDEMTQIKILQILLIFLNPNNLRLSKEFVDTVLQCSFQMFYSKSNSVKSTIQATLRQLFTIVFDKFVLKCKEQAKNDDFFDPKRRLYLPNEERQKIQQRLKQIEQDTTFKVTTDLISNLSHTLALQDSEKKIQQHQNIWNLQPSIHSKCMIMDIICLILTQTQDVFSFFPLIQKIFENELIPILELMYKQKQPQQEQYIVGMRLMKCTIMIINNLGIGVNLLQHVLQETDGFIQRHKDGTNTMQLNWKSLIGFECLAIALNNPTLIKIFSQSALQVGKTVLVQVFESLVQATDNLDLTGDLNQKHMSNPYYSHLKSPKYIEAQILENELPPPSPSQIHKLIIEAVCSFVDNMILIFDQSGLKIGSKQPSKSSANDSVISGPHTKLQSQKSNLDIDCKELLLLSWKPLLLVLQNLLRLTHEESNIQMLLNCYQNFIGVCGSVHCFEPRDGFLESLCSFCLSEQNGGANVGTRNKLEAQPVQASQSREFYLTDKNVQICKTLLNIAHCLGYILDVKSWYIILETMQRIETVIKLRVKTKGKTVVAGQNPAQPMINQSGNQTLVDFNEIKLKVQDKVKEYNLQERFSSAHAKKPSNVPSEEEEKKSDWTSESEDKNRASVQQRRTSQIEGGKKSIQSSQQKVSLPTSYQQDKNLQMSFDSTTSGASSQFTGIQPMHVSSSAYESTHSIQMNTDLQILMDSFDSLFTSSILFDQQSLAELITSLGQLTVGVLENLNKKKGQQEKQGNDKAVRGATSKHQPNEGDILANINTFAITRLVETALVNISRIEQIWKILIAHFDILANCKVQMLRQLSIEALLCIILEIFAYRKDHKAHELKNPFPQSPLKSRQNSKTQKKSISSSGAEDDADLEMDFDVDENWSGTVWQYTILTPFSDQLKSPHQSNNLQTLKGIEKIIQTCGQQLKNDGWRIIIITISKTSELMDNEQIVATGFRCLKLIVSNYIDKLTQDNFISILHAVHRYAANDGDNINNNLTAVGMFHNIADYTAKQMLKDNTSVPTGNAQSQVFNPQRIWSILFEKIQELGSDYRAEVRRTNIHTLENILMTHGQLLQDQVWNAILKNNLLNMLKLSVEMYIQQKQGPNQKNTQKFMEAGLPTPSFSSGGWETKKKGQTQQQKKMKFDDDVVLKALQKNNDEQWEETCLLMVQTVLRSLKKYTQMEIKRQRLQSLNLFSNELLDFVWNNSVSIILELIKNGSQEICSTVYKAIEDLLQHPNCVSLFMNNIGISFKILDATSEWLCQEKQDTPLQRKPHNLKLCPVIIDTLKKIYNQENLQENHLRAPFLQIIIPTYAQILLQLLYKMMKSGKNQGEGFQGMGVPHKLMTEEKITFEFIEQLNEVVRKNEQTHLLYLKFLLQFTEYDVSEPHSEAFIRRVFSIMNGIILQGKVSQEILKEILPILYDRIEQLISLRYNNEACMGLVFPSKGSQTLFYTVGLYAMHFSSFLINPSHFKQRMTAHYKQSQEQQRGPNQIPQSTGSTGGFAGLKAKAQNVSTLNVQGEEFLTHNDIMFSEQLEFNIVDPQMISASPEFSDPSLKSLVWNRVLPLARGCLLFNPDKVANHNKAVVEDVVKSSQDLDMQVMNFITNSLLPNCQDVNDKEFQQSLVQIIDNGCNSVYSSQRLSSQAASSTSPFGNSLSKYCLNNLFELCRQQQFKVNSTDDLADQNAQKKIYDIRKKIATITTPVLINRCRDTLKKYVTDEQKSGTTTLPRQRVSEVVFILEKLRLLDCYIETQPSQYKNKKGHLVQLMPILADLVLSNEVSLKEHLRQIFLDISEAIAQSQMNKIGGEGQNQSMGDSSGGEFF